MKISHLCLVFGLSLLTTLSVHAKAEDFLRDGLITPELIRAIGPELALSAEQESQMQSIVAEAQTEATPLEGALRERQQELGSLLKKSGSTLEETQAALTLLLEAEAPVKQLRLRTLLRLRDVLTPEQQEKARSLGPDVRSKLKDMETQVRAKAGKLQAALEGIGVPATEKMKQRGEEIEALLKAGDFATADKALDQLIADAELDKPTDTPPDFSQFEPGNTDLETLKQRYETIISSAQKVVSLAMMRQFLQAKDALEQAKQAQDAVAVGRILTWAEGELAKVKP